MPKYTSSSDNLKKYAETQFEIFKKETGFSLKSNIGEQFLKFIGNEVEVKANEMGDDFVQLNAVWETDKIIGNNAKDIIENVFESPNLRVEKPYTDNQFETIMDSFLKCINNIGMAYKKEHQIKTYLHQTNSLSGLKKGTVQKLYRDYANGGKNHMESFSQKYNAIKSGKSSAMCTDMDTLLEGPLDPESINKIAAVYTSLKAKQKKNSIFTNWLNKRGYNERAAIKACETKLMEKLGCKDVKAFETLMKKRSEEPSKLIAKYNNLYDKEKKDTKNPSLDAFVEFEKATNKEQYLEEQLQNTKQQIKNENEVEQIEVVESVEAGDYKLGAAEEEHGVLLENYGPNMNKL